MWGAVYPCPWTWTSKPFTSAITDRALTWMAARHTPLGLLDLPTEILENVVLQLRAQEILRLRIVMPFPSLFQL